MSMMSEARTILSQMIVDLLRSSHQVYFPDLKFMPAVEATIIVCVVFLQQVAGEPYTEAELRTCLQMSKGTMERRIAWLRRNGIIIKRRRRIMVDVAVISAAHSMKNALTARDIVIAAGVALAQMPVPPLL
jgi:hypothetical protein